MKELNGDSSSPKIHSMYVTNCICIWERFNSYIFEPFFRGLISVLPREIKNTTILQYFNHPNKLVVSKSKISCHLKLVAWILLYHKLSTDLNFSKPFKPPETRFVWRKPVPTSKYRQIEFSLPFCSGLDNGNPQNC